MWLGKLIYQPCYVVVFIKRNMIISEGNEILLAAQVALHVLLKLKS